MKKLTKENLPSKICQTCKKSFVWRKKWEKVWSEVKFCSDKCRLEKNQTDKQKLRDKIVDTNKTATLIFPHQLFEKNPAIFVDSEIFLVEEFLFFSQYSQTAALAGLEETQRRLLRHRGARAGVSFLRRELLAEPSDDGVVVELRDAQ